jgi:hypothetical protein
MLTRPLALALFALGCASSPAAANTWSDYAELFSDRPCADGWMACVVAGRHHTTESVRRDAKVSAPANARVDFIDLRPTAVFDPFGTLSDYTVLSPTRVRPETSPSPASGTRAPREPVGGVSTEVDAAITSPDPVLDAVLLDEDGAGGRDDKVAVTPLEDESPSEKVEDYVVDAETTDGCTDMAHLSALAANGRLDGPSKACLADRIRTSPDHAARDAASRLLIQNAWKSDRDSWAVLTRQHLESIDSTSAELAYALARHCHREGLHTEALRWSELAWTHKTRWSGEAFARRAAALQKLRALSSYALLQQVEQEGKSPTDPARREALQSARTAARAWRAHLQGGGADDTEALALCDVLGCDE